MRDKIPPTTLVIIHNSKWEFMFGSHMAAAEEGKLATCHPENAITQHDVAKFKWTVLKMTHTNSSSHSAHQKQ